MVHVWLNVYVYVPISGKVKWEDECMHIGKNTLKCRTPGDNMSVNPYISIQTPVEYQSDHMQSPG